MDSVLRVTNLILFLMAVAVYVYGIFCCRWSPFRSWAQLILLFYAVHAVAFYVATIAMSANIVQFHEFLNTWSKVLRFHGAVALLSREVVAIVNEKLYANIK